MSATYRDVRPVAAAMPDTEPLARSRVSWPAIFAGVVLVIAIEVLFGVLGTGVGLNLVSPNTGTTPDAGNFGIGAGVWGLLTTVVALVVGGYVAARLAAAPSRFDGVLHGLVIWGVALLLTTYLLTSAAGGLIGGVSSMIGGTLSAAGSAISNVGGGLKSVLPQAQQTAGVNANMLQQQAENVLQSPTPPDPANMSRPDAVKAIGAAMPDLLGDNDKSAAAKQRITDIVAAQSHISPQDAQKRVDDVQARLIETKNQAAQAARQTADAAAAAASHASFLAFAGLVAGALAAAIGGAMASPRLVGQGRVELGGGELAAGRFR